jgi:hypothetical protein
VDHGVRKGFTQGCLNIDLASIRRSKVQNETHELIYEWRDDLDLTRKRLPQFNKRSRMQTSWRENKTLCKSYIADFQLTPPRIIRSDMAVALPVRQVRFARYRWTRARFPCLAACDLLSVSFPLRFLKLVTGERHFYSSSNDRRKTGSSWCSGNGQTEARLTIFPSDVNALSSLLASLLSNYCHVGNMFAAGKFSQ